jgi:hypothetical protein
MAFKLGVVFKLKIPWDNPRGFCFACLAGSMGESRVLEPGSADVPMVVSLVHFPLGASLIGQGWAAEPVVEGP